MVTPNTVEGGGVPTVTVTGLDTAVAPKLSVARALKAYVPFPTPLQE
jgi:hypothetical protein